MAKGKKDPMLRLALFQCEDPSETSLIRGMTAQDLNDVKQKDIKTYRPSCPAEACMGKMKFIGWYVPEGKNGS